MTENVQEPSNSQIGFFLTHYAEVVQYRLGWGAENLCGNQERAAVPLLREESCTDIVQKQSSYVS